MTIYNIETKRNDGSEKLPSKINLKRADEMRPKIAGTVPSSVKT